MKLVTSSRLHIYNNGNKHAMSNAHEVDSAWLFRTYTYSYLVSFLLLVEEPLLCGVKHALCVGQLVTQQNQLGFTLKKTHPHVNSNVTSHAA